MDMTYDGALVMPMGCAMMDEEEMTYVEGGYKKVVKPWGIGVKLSGNETSQFLSDASWAAVVLCGAIGIANGVAAGVAGICIGVCGLAISRCNANNSGVTLMWTWANLATKNPAPMIIDNY